MVELYKELIQYWDVAQWQSKRLLINRFRVRAPASQPNSETIYTDQNCHNYILKSLYELCNHPEQHKPPNSIDLTIIKKDKELSDKDLENIKKSFSKGDNHGVYLYTAARKILKNFLGLNFERFVTIFRRV